MIEVLSVRRKGWLAEAVSFFTGSDINHTAIRINGTVYEMLKGGIRYDSYENYAKEYYIYRHNMQTILEPAKALDFIRDNRFRKYDWWRTLTWPFRKLFLGGTKKEWNCVEFIVELFRNQNIDLVGNRNVSPYHLFEVLKALEAKKYNERLPLTRFGI